MYLNEFVGKLSIEMMDFDLQDAISELDSRTINSICKVKYRRQIMEAGCIKEPLNPIKMFHAMDRAYSSKANVNKSIHSSSHARIIPYM